MRFFHISDLHIGKRVNGFSMLEDQKLILQQILDLAEKYCPDGVLIAGDLYDKSMPSGEAVETADEFLFQLSKQGIPVWAVSGNHDSPERIAYGARMMDQAGIHMSRVFDGKLQRHTFTDKKGETVDLYLLPFIKPGTARKFFPQETVMTTQEAVSLVLGQERLLKDRPNLLVMHQFLAGASTCDSEEIQVGGADQVDASLTDSFDYVALGHLHGPQKIGRETVRYCGSPLKYSFSEVSHRKSVTVVDISWENQEKSGKEKKKWKIEVSTLPLRPRRDLRRLKGPLEELLKPEIWQQGNREDYVQVVLTDREPVLDAVGKIRSVYPNVMQIDFELPGQKQEDQEETEVREKTPLELFEEFYEKQAGEKITEKQLRTAQRILNQMKEDKA